MKAETKTDDEFTNLIEDEKKCILYLERQRWGGNPICPHCGSERVYRTNRGFKCSNKECYKKFTVLTGTIFENSKLSLSLWFSAISLCTMSEGGISSVELGCMLDLTQKTAWFMLHRIREMLKDKAPHMLNATNNGSYKPPVMAKYCGQRQRANILKDDKMRDDDADELIKVIIRPKAEYSNKSYHN